MKYMLLVSHGTMAKGLYDAAGMVLNCGEKLSYLCLSEDMDVEKYNRELETKLAEIIEKDKIYDYEDFVICSDIMGGSPCNSALALLEKQNLINMTFVITGMNLPLVTSILLEDEKLDTEKINVLKDEARESIQMLNFNSCSETDEEL